MIKKVVILHSFLYGGPTRLSIRITHHDPPSLRWMLGGECHRAAVAIVRLRQPMWFVLTCTALQLYSTTLAFALRRLAGICTLHIILQACAQSTLRGKISQKHLSYFLCTGYSPSLTSVLYLRKLDYEPHCSASTYSATVAFIFLYTKERCTFSLLIPARSYRAIRSPASSCGISANVVPTA